MAFSDRQALTEKESENELIENIARQVVGMEGLPEGCISYILSLTSPHDACRSSAVSEHFQSAAGSDSVWEKFLPSDYKEILSDSVTPVHFSTKKELYAQSPIFLRGGTKSFQLEKKSGKKCYMLGARELFICWGDTPEYWNWQCVLKSRFREVARLKVVCRLVIVGLMKTKMSPPNTTYVAYFVYMLDVYSNGFENYPINVSVSVIDSRVEHIPCWLAVQLEDKALDENFPKRNTIYVNTPELPFHEWWEVEVPKKCGYVPHE